MSTLKDPGAPQVHEAPEVVTMGEAMISFRSPRRIALGSPVTPGLAGAETNVAIALARLGHRSRWVGRIGADVFGRLAVRELRAEGVDVDSVIVEEPVPVGAPTGLMFLEQHTADLSRVEYRRVGSAGSRLVPDDVVTLLEPRPRALHLTGVTPALSESARQCCQAAVIAASDAKVFVSLDVNFRARLWGREEARAELSQLADYADLLVASEDELDLVADGDEAVAVTSLLARGVGQVVVKRGSAGATLWTTHGRFDCPAVPVTAVDTVGAGDAFCAGFLSGWLDDLDPAGCLHRGVVLGAFAVSTSGDFEGLPHRAELDHLDRVSLGESLR